MTLIPQKDIYRKPHKKKRVFTEKEEELPEYEENFFKLLKKKKREIKDKKLSFRETIILSAYQILGNEGNLKNPHGWIKLDIF